MMKKCGKIAGLTACLATIVGCSSKPPEVTSIKAIVPVPSAQAIAQAKSDHARMLQNQALYWLQHGQGNQAWLKPSTKAKPQ